jgi:hypothetical protein
MEDTLCLKIKINIHPSHVLCPLCVSRKLGINKKDISQNDIPIRNKGLA